MTIKQKEGFELMSGASLYIALLFIVGVLISFGLNAIYLSCGIGIDDSDTSKWNRSGLKIHRDAKTGIEYLSDGRGGLVRREAIKTNK